MVNNKIAGFYIVKMPTKRAYSITVRWIYLLSFTAYTKISATIMTAINGKMLLTDGYSAKNTAKCSKEICSTAYIMKHLQRNLIVQGIKSQGLYLVYKINFLRKLNKTRNIHYISIKFAL